MSSTSGNMGATYFPKISPNFFDTSSAGGYMGAKYVQEFGARFWACHVPNVACHGVSCPQLVGTWVQTMFRNLVKIYMPVLCQEYMLFSCLPLSVQPRLNTQQQGRAPPVCPPTLRGPLLLLCAEEVEPWLTTQWQTEK